MSGSFVFVLLNAHLFESQSDKEEQKEGEIFHLLPIKVKARLGKSQKPGTYLNPVECDRFLVCGRFLVMGT